MSADAAALYHRGAALLAQGSLEEALEAFQSSLALKDHPAAHYDMGNALLGLGRLEDAVASFDAAIKLQPDFSAAFNNRAGALEDLGRFEEALESYTRAIAAAPDNAAAHYNRGNIFLKILRRPTEALACFDQAIALKGVVAESYNHRGAALRDLNRLEEALASFDQAIAANPQLVGAHVNRGATLQGLRRYDEAATAYETALRSAPDDPDAQWNTALLELLSGDFENGWRRYEWRWKIAELRPSDRGFSQPLWLGDFEIGDKTLLIHAEQGFGDTIQFCRYVPLAARLAKKVIFEVPAPLAALMTHLAPNTEVIARGRALPPFDAHIPLLSLPLAFKTTLATLPAPATYLTAATEKVGFWTEKLGPKIRPRVGLVWSGGTAHRNDINRSSPLADVIPLLGANAEFHCVQKEVRDADRGLLQTTRIQSHEADLDTFADTAALITQMDLVIAVDTAVAHLAGALGKPVWILLPYAPDFRWLTGRSDSPWYPSARLFRQAERNEWPDVVSDVAKALRDFVMARPQ